MIKPLSTMQETWVRSLGQEDPLEKEMAIHSSTSLESSILQRSAFFIVQLSHPYMTTGSLGFAGF